MTGDLEDRFFSQDKNFDHRRTRGESLEKREANEALRPRKSGGGV